jgi:HEAT repeat protein
MLGDPDSGVRYWAAEGCLALGKDAAPAQTALTDCLTDSAGNVRIAAAWALCKISQNPKALEVIVTELDNPNRWIRLHAANALDYLGEQARPYESKMKAKLNDEVNYVVRVMEKALADLNE